MLGDIVTKILQGALFRKFKAEIMNISDGINTEKMGMDHTDMKKGTMWKLHNKTDPECPQECVGDFENVSGLNGDENRFLGTVSRVCEDTSKGVLLHGKKRNTKVKELR